MTAVERITAAEAYECGTYRAYQRHVRRRETVDPACRAIANEHMRKYRKAHPEAYLSTAARGRALTRLAAKYPGVYRRLYAAELAAVRDEFHADRESVS